MAHAACAFRDKIYVVGRVDAVENVVTRIDCYNPVNNVWSIMGNAIDILYHHTIVVY